MDVGTARRILDATLPAWADGPPAWDEVLRHESVRPFHSILVHAIEQRGWEDAMDAALDLIERPSARAEDVVLAQALASFVESTGALPVPAPPTAPRGLRRWAEEVGVGDLLDEPPHEVDGLRATWTLAVAPTLEDAYRAAAAVAFGPVPDATEREVAERILRALHGEAMRRAQPDPRVPRQRTLEGVEPALSAEAAEPERVERLEWRVSARDGVVTVWPYLQKARRDGGWTRGKRLASSRLFGSRVPTGNRSERLAVMLLSRSSQASSRVAAGVLADVIELLRGARLVHADSDAPVRVRRVRPRLGFEPAGGALVPRIHVGGAALSPEDAHGRLRTSEVLVALEEGERPTLWIAPCDRAERGLVEALATRSARIPDEPEARRALVRRLPALVRRMELSLPDELRGRAVPGDHRPVVRLDLRQTSLAVSLGIRPLPDLPLLAAGEGQSLAVSFVEDEPVHVRRHLGRERQVEDAWIERLSLAPHRQPDGSFLIDGLDGALALVETVQAHPGELRVEWAREERPRIRAVTSSDLRVVVSRSRRWFEVRGGADTDLGHVDLAALMRAAREGSRFVEIAPGAYARIEASLRRRLLHADAHLLEERGERVFGSPAALAVADLAADAALDAPAAFHDLVARTRRAREEEPRVPEGLADVLRPYQRAGFEWLARLGAWGVGGVLADDMGLGKTVQALALLCTRAGEGPALVVAPTSVVGNWAREAERFTPELRVRIHRGAPRERSVGSPRAGEVLVTSYDIASRDIEELARVRFGTVVLDEAQLVKNPATRRARTMRDLSADLKVALTGTPIENQLGELWSIFRIVCPELLGSWPSFKQRFAIPVERDGDRRRLEQLAALVRPFVLRRTKAEVAPELPPRTEAVLEIALSDEERALYERERQRAVAATAARDGDTRFALLAALTRLRQIACDARLVEEGWRGPTSKVDEAARVVSELRREGHRVLVFSQFTRLLALVRERLVADGVVCLELVGETPALERERRVQRFQDGGADAFLISLKAGGTGLNLTAATYVLHLDPWWNPAAEDQATDRAHRIGQTEPVTVYRLVSGGTIEEAVLAMHGDKRALADGVLAGADAAARLDPETLAELLRAG